MQLNIGGTWLGLGRPPQTYLPPDQIEVHVRIVRVCQVCVRACVCQCVFTLVDAVTPQETHRDTNLFAPLLKQPNPVEPPGRAYTAGATTVQGPRKVISVLSQTVQFTDYTNRAAGQIITTSTVLISLHRAYFGLLEVMC